MNHTLAWIQKFIDPSEQKALYALTAQKSREALLQYLKTGKISVTDYLNWASNFFLLPYVDPEFFKQGDIKGTWTKYADLTAWRSDLLPLDFFDGNLIIGCVIPPNTEELKLDIKYQLVLAAPSDLEGAWASLGGTSPDSFSEQTSFTKAHGTVVEPLPDLSAGTSTKTKSIPNGGFKIDLDVSHMVVLPNLSEGTQIHSLSGSVTNVVSHAPPPVPPKAPTSAPPRMPPSAPPIAMVDALTNPSMSGIESTTFRKKIDMSRNESQIKRMTFDECNGLEEIGDLMFLKMRDHFEKYMLLLLQDEALVPWLWSGSFLPINNNSPAPVSLVNPSLFRIVYTSGKPYHGRIVPNPTNNAFFTEWNSGHVPKHASCFPIYINKTFAGVWFAATDKQIDMQTSLADFDSWVSASTEAFLRALNSAAS